MVIEPRQEHLQHASCVAHQRRIDRIAQRHAFRIEFDLDARGFARLGIVLDTREARTDDEQSIASLQRLSGQSRAEKSDAAGGKGMIVWQNTFIQKRLDHRDIETFGSRLDPGLRPERTSPAKIAIFRPSFRMAAARAI